MNPQDAKFIIECLRAGIASTAVSELFSQGQGRLTNTALELLDRGRGAMAIEGGYGQGKTHFLKHLAQVARRRGYVVSLVTLSKETPFQHWWHLYGAAISQAERPDAPQEPGIRGLLRRYKWTDEPIQALAQFSTELHPRLGVALQAYYETSDSEVQYRIAGDLMGHALTNGELARLYKAGTNTRVKLPAARLTQTGRDYFAFAGKLFQAAGYAGWLILFDEFELVCKLSSLQRARAYANLAAFRRLEPLPGFERIAAVVAYIPAMVTEYLAGGKCDLASLPNLLRLRGLTEEGDAAEATLRWLVEGKQSISVMSEADARAVLDRIADLHQQAYGWKRPRGDFYSPATSAAERMRTRVRFCVEALDLARVYHEIPTLQTREIQLPKLAEDEALFSGNLDDVVVEDVER